MNNVYIVAAKRTAIGSYLGALKDVSPAQLGATVVSTIINDTKIDTKDIDEVIVGNILPAGQGQGVGRQVAILGGVDQSVAAYAINMACGSGMKAVMNAYQSIKSGTSHLILAGGAESMSQSPFLIPSSTRSGHKMGNMTLVDHMINDALTDAFTHIHMGVTAENIASQYGITREAQDTFAFESQQKAINAVDAGIFKEEIVPVTIKTRKGDVIVDTDEYPNRTTTLDKLATLRPAFVKEGTVTAGNASGLNDGASMVCVASEAMVEKYNLTPLVRIRGIGQGGVDPQVMGLGPTPAILQALKHAECTLDDIDVIELNEAFAAQSLGVIHELVEKTGINRDALLGKTNIHGGAIALGHPVGASGNRILVTLIHELLRSDKKLGLASLCIGGGMGTAIIVEKVEQ